MATSHSPGGGWRTKSTGMLRQPSCEEFRSADRRPDPIIHAQNVGQNFPNLASGSYSIETPNGDHSNAHALVERE